MYASLSVSEREEEAIRLVLDDGRKLQFSLKDVNLQHPANTAVYKRLRRRLKARQAERENEKSAPR